MLYLTTPNLLSDKLVKDSVVMEFPVEDGSHVVRGYSFTRLKNLLNENNLHVIEKSYLTRPFSILFINLDRICNFLYLRVFIFPLIIIANLLDMIFFKNRENNLTIALVVEKIV